MMNISRSASKGKLKINIKNVPGDMYSLEVYKTGYRNNDAYSTYLSLGKPAQLTRHLVDQIEKQNDGSPISREIVTIKGGILFSKEQEIRKNDVFFVNLIKW